MTINGIKVNNEYEKKKEISYNGFYKVAEEGFSFTSVTMWNPETKEEYSKIVWDIDDDRYLFDKERQTLRYMPINEKYQYQYWHEKGVIQPGDTIRVFKGRKVPIGTIATVIDIKPWRDKYGRVQCDYCYLDNGMRTNIANCELV